jgi:hypothetical protein
VALADALNSARAFSLGVLRGGRGLALVALRRSGTDWPLCFPQGGVSVGVDTILESSSSETRTAKEYYRDHRDRVMVVNAKEGQALESRHFFVVESVGTLSDGLLVSGLFDHNRRDRLRSHQVRLATEQEIASRYA